MAKRPVASEMQRFFEPSCCSKIDVCLMIFFPFPLFCSNFHSFKDPFFGKNVFPSKERAFFSSVACCVCFFKFRCFAGISADMGEVCGCDVFDCLASSPRLPGKISL